jgi:regulator of protease activity HflC (stomatin/prohibitin superfamily)
MSNRFTSNPSVVVLIITGVASLLIIAIAMFGLPLYTVYKERLRGEAELARAESNRRILIQEANAKMESAKSLAEAEIIRARGVAEANKIIGDSLTNNEAYLRYLYIQGLAETGPEGKTVIYIPTEAGQPILEAGRLKP